MDLFIYLRCFSHVTAFGQAALQYHQLELLDTEKKHTKSSKSAATAHDQQGSNLLSRLFTAALDSAQYEIAYSALARISDVSLRKASLTQFVTTMITNRKAETLLSFPFPSLSTELDTVLASLAHKSLNASSFSGSLYFRALYALRVQRSDFNGAAQCLWEYLQRLKGANESTADPRDEHIAETYLLVINALRCCGPDEGWVLDDPTNTSGANRVSFVGRLSGADEAKKTRKRKVVFLADVRKEYGELLDRISDLEGGRFAFGQPDDMELDGPSVL
jgi:hypothetical protein